jgi:hypothetical protein
MDEFFIDPHHARIDEHVLDRPVLAAQPSGIFLESLARAQSAKDCADSAFVNVKFGD